MNQQLLQQAMALHQQGRTAEAEPLYRQALVTGPDAKAQYLLTVLLFQQQRMPEAAAAADTLLSLDPGAVQSLMLKGVIALSLGRHGEALAALAAVTARQPGNAEAWYNQGVALAQLERHGEAVAAFDRALAGKPGAAAWTMRGTSLQAQGEHAAALASHEKALALEPGFIPALYNSGVALLSLQQFDRAVPAFDKMLAVKPDAHDAWNNRGAALQQLSRFEDALASYDRALAIKPDYAAAWKNRGHALTLLKRYDDALGSYDRAVSTGLGNEIADAYSGRGDVLRHRQRFADAVASYDQALALAPGSPEAFANRGACLQMVLRFEEAQASVEQALALDPDHLHALACKGSLMCEMGRFDEGMASYARRAALAAEAPSAPGDADFKVRHDDEQRAWLAAQGVTAPGFHIEGGARLAGPAINPANAQTIAADWAGSDPKLVVIDNLLTPDALAGLYRFAQGSTVWRKPYPNGYLGAMPEHGFAAPLLAQIAEELRDVFPGIFAHHGLCQWWGFKYDSDMAGIRLHADQAVVNVNFWITPDSANLNPDNGGLVVWDRKPPQDWDSRRANGDDAAARVLLRETGAKPVTVPYRANRAVIFDSDLFHETDVIEFAPGYQNRRINVTMLFGRRGG
jgi:tetratricopeptide (TPR) repeat protein